MLPHIFYRICSIVLTFVNNNIPLFSPDVFRFAPQFPKGTEGQCSSSGIHLGFKSSRKTKAPHIFYPICFTVLTFVNNNLPLFSPDVVDVDVAIVNDDATTAATTTTTAVSLDDEDDDHDDFFLSE